MKERARKFLNVLLWPNQFISSRTLLVLAIMQAVVALVVWSRSDSAVFPHPPDIWNAFKMMWTEKGLARELVTSYKLNLEALIRATLIALPIAYLTRFNFFRPVVGLVTKGRFLGLTGLTFFFTVTIGGGHPLKVWLLVFGMAVFLGTSMVDVVRQISQTDYDYPRTLRMGEWGVLWYAVIRGTLDKAFDVIRQNAAIGWTMLTMVEGLSRSEGGVGTLLLNENKHLRLDAVFAIQISIFLLGLGQDMAIGWLKNKVCPYVKFLQGER